MTFSEIMGHIVTTVLKDRMLMPQAKRELEMWYNAQPLEGRKDLARKTKQEFEYARGIIESAFHHFMSAAYQDLQ